MNTMTISTQYFKIIFIGFPISKSARPVINPFLWRKFCALIDVMNIQYTNIIITAFNTFTAKRFYKFDFAFPVTLFFAQVIAVFIPEVFLTFFATKFSFCWISAVMAFSITPPASSMIAGRTAIFNPCLAPISFAKRNIKTLLAILANKCYSVFSHSNIISQLPIYYAIAEKRIKDAQQQMRLPL